MRARVRSALNTQSATRSCGGAAATRRNPWWSMTEPGAGDRETPGIVSIKPLAASQGAKPQADSLFLDGQHPAADFAVLDDRDIYRTEGFQVRVVGQPGE